MRRRLSVSALAIGFALCGTAVFAKPAVSLHLKGSLVSTTPQGVKLTPLASVSLKPGDLVRYDIHASNDGSDPAAALTPVGKIPTGTEFAAGTAAGDATRVEYTLDGRTWSSQPTVVVHTPTGDVRKPASPARYVALRWIAAHALAPKASMDFTYEVRVK